MSDDSPQDTAPEAPAERALDMAGAGQIILPAKLDGHKSRPRPATVKRPRPAATPKRK